MASPAIALTSIGGYTFQDNAFADAVTDVSGDYRLKGADSVAGAVTGFDVSSYAKSRDAVGYMDIAFTDNVAFNGAGSDLVLFELGSADSFFVTINGVTRSAQSLATGITAGGYSLNAAALDFDLFGLAEGALVDSFRLSFMGTPDNTAAVASVGALNSRAVSAVPEAATWALMVAGFGTVGASMRRRRTTVKFA